MNIYKNIEKNINFYTTCSNKKSCNKLRYKYLINLIKTKMNKMRTLNTNNKYFKKYYFRLNICIARVINKSEKSK